MEAGQVYVIVGANTGPLSAGLASARGQVQSFARSTSANFSRAAGFVSKWAKRGGIALLGMGAAATHLAMDFEAAMERVHTQAGASQKEVDSLKGKVLELAKSMRQSPEELAMGLYHLESVGLRGAKALDTLKIAAEGAAVGNANLEDTASALGGAWMTAIKGAHDLHQTMGVLNATIGAGNMQMDELNLALGTGILPAAKAAGLGIKDVGAALATMTDENMHADAAATRLRMAFSLLAAPSKAANKVLKGIGLTGLMLGHQMQGPGGLIGALSMLKEHLEKVEDPAKRMQILSRAFGGGRSSAAIELLLNNLDRVKMKYDQISKTAGNFDEAVGKTQATAAYKLHSALSTLEASLIEIGEHLAPTFAGAMTGIAEAFDRHSESIEGAVTSLVEWGREAATVAGNVLRALAPVKGFFQTEVGSAVGVGIVSMVAFGGAAVVAAEKVMKLKEAFSALGKAGPIMLGLTALVGIGSAVVYAVHKMGGEAQYAGQEFSEAAGAVRDYKNATNELVKSAKEAKQAALDEQGAELRLEQARKTAKQTLQQYGKKSLEYRNAAYQVKQAQFDLKNATQRVADAVEHHRQVEAKQRAGLEKVKDSLDNYRAAMQKATTTMHKGDTTLDHYASATEQVQQRQEHAQAVTEDFITKMSGLSRQLATTNAKASAFAGTAAALAAQIHRIPSRKEVTIFYHEIHAIDTVEINRAGTGGHVGAQGHALGGRTLAGRTYLVGERGPELFRPDVGGRVFSTSTPFDPTAGRGMGGDVIVVDNVLSVDGEVLYRAQRRAERRHVMRNGGR